MIPRGIAGHFPSDLQSWHGETVMGAGRRFDYFNGNSHAFHPAAVGSAKAATLQTGSLWDFLLLRLRPLQRD
jgi:hypothetical protein